MILKSKFHFLPVIFSFIGISAAIYWILLFLIFIIFRNGFHLINLVSLPVLFIPIWLIYIFQHFSTALGFSSIGIKIKKMLILNYKFIEWNNIDYFFITEECGKGGCSEVIYLVKDKKLILRISESIYRNYEDIKIYISSHVENKGFLKLKFFESFNYLINRKNKNLP